MIYAAAAARDEGLLKTGRIGIVLVPDEETAGPRGSRDLEARGLLGRDGVGMLTPEPTGGVVWNANRGAISLRAIMRGKAAHVGPPIRRRKRVRTCCAGYDAASRYQEGSRAPRNATRHRSGGGAKIHPDARRTGSRQVQISMSRPISVPSRLTVASIPKKTSKKRSGRLCDALEGFEIETLQEEPAAATPAQDPLGAFCRAILRT